MPLFLDDPTPGEDCDCLAAESEHGRPLDRAEHASCGLSNSGGSACGGCDSCLSAQIHYYTHGEVMPRPGSITPTGT